MVTIQQRPPREPIVLPGQIEHHAADMSVTFSADLTLSQLQERLAEKNQWLPIDGDPAMTTGELVLRNSTGPLRFGYGAWRDLLLGAQFTNGRGELLSVGGRVVKNVAGYDVTKLLIGSHGVFGRPITLTTRTYKRPQAALHVMFERGRLKLAEVLASPLRPQWISQAGSFTVGYLGDTASVERYREHVAGMNPRHFSDRATIDEDSRQRHLLWPALSSPTRVAVPPARVDEILERSKLSPYLADPAFGIVLSGAGSTIDRDAIRAAARVVGGHAMFYDESGGLIEMSMDPKAFEVLQCLKTAFDPDGSLPPLPRNVK